MKQPTEDQRRLLAHVVRYRVTTPEALHVTLYADRSKAAAAKAASRTEEAGFLERFQLSRRIFYYLSKEATSVLGVPPSAASPPGTQALSEHYAVLAFCALREPGTERLTPEEVREHFPEFAEAPGVSAAHQHYCVTRYQGHPVLARATVDTGAELRRVVDKCRVIASHAAETAGLLELARTGRFHVAVLTADESKKRALDEALSSLSSSTRFRAVTIPEMRHIL